MFKGFVLQNMDKSKNSNERKLNIYYFNNSEQLQNAIKEFKELQTK